MKPDVKFWAEHGAMLLKSARHTARLHQQQLAEGSGTSRTTLSAYEHGRKSPTLETAGRILDAAGFRLALEPKVEFAGSVPSCLPRLPIAVALGIVAHGGRVYDLADREQRRAAYTALLCEGGPQDLLDHVDGVLLVELWEDLDLPVAVRTAWAPLVERARRGD
ncbi:helix-turn-helix domain-containing protein [Nonomuraea sp. SBT364]|uniref:helix-turn-helix domain-containing protein n=1 Tax=Nonomuraea sp. SBT364 TaxID=1580530 RepID=UPI00066D5596|nr:helix-turn-helix transcriptional regulator [Nonomuraea sp. SBT364]